MKTPFKRAIVYDIETGGLNVEHNNITEIAMVAVDLESLEIIDEVSVLIKPRLNLSNRLDDMHNEAKVLYKECSEKNDNGEKFLSFAGNNYTVMDSTEAILEPLKDFHSMIDKMYAKKILSLTDIIKLLQDPRYSDITKLYFNKAYNKEALDVTGISTELLVSDGVEYEEAYNIIKGTIDKHKLGNSKPIIAGHNIGSLPRRILKGKEVKPDGFDNPFMEKFFHENGDCWFSSINDVIIDTLKMARLKWRELPNYALGTCANELGMTLENAHRALPDTIANAKVLIKMLKSLRGEGAGQSTYTRKKFNLNY